MKSLVHLTATTCLALVFICASRPADGQTWQNGGNSLWSNPLNWDFGVPNSGSTAVFDATGSTTVDLGGASHDLFGLVFNFGAQSYTLTGNTGDALNFTTGGAINSNSAVAQVVNSALTLNGGPFSISNDGAGLLTLGGGVTLASGTADVLNVAGSGNTTISGPIALGAITGLSKTGIGTLTLSGASTYTGATTITEGTLAIAANNALGVGPMVIGSMTTPPATVSSLNFGGNQSLQSLNVATDSTANNTISIGAGNTLTLTGSAQANVLSVGAVGRSNRLVMSGSGAFTINDASRNIVVYGGAARTTSDPTPPDNNAILDMSDLATFNATVAGIFVGRPTTTAGAVTTGITQNDRLALADNNTITASGNIVVGATSSSGGQNTSFMTLGQTNNIGANQWVIGAGRPGGDLRFQPGLVNPTVNLYGSAGPASRTSIVLGDGKNLTGVASGAGGSSSSTGTMDFTGGTLTAMIETLTVGNGGSVASSTRGRGNGVFTFGGAGSSVNVNTLFIATNAADSTTVTTNNVTSTGSLTVNGGSLTVNSSFVIARNLDNSGGTGQQSLDGTFTLNSGNVTVGSTTTPVDTTLGVFTSTGTGTNTATLTINGGTYTSHGNIVRGSAAGGGVFNTTLTLDGGTLDMTGDNIGGGGVLITNLNFRSGTLSNVNQINNGAGLTKTTAGTLNVTGANNFTGNVNLNEGTLNFQPTTTHSLGSGNITMAAGTTLGVKAFSTSSPVMTTAGGLSLGGGTVNMTLAGNPTVPLLIPIGTFSTAGTNTINIATTGALTSGTYTLIDYFGAIGGDGFAGLTLGTMPLRSSGMLVNNIAGTSVDIDITADAIRWNGDLNNVWDINTTNNWKLITAGTSTGYLEPSSPGEPVRFDDSAVGNFNVNVSTNVNPISVTFDNATNAYTLSGSGDLSTPTLTKLGSNTATISTTGALNIGTMALNGPGALVIDRADNPTISSALTGTGTLRKVGLNTVTLAGNSAGFTGMVDISAGTLNLGSGNALGNSTVNINGGAVLELNGQTLVFGTGGVSAFTGGGPVTATTSGTLVVSSTNTVAQPLTGNATLAVNAPGGVATVTGGSNTYAGGTNLTAGTLALSGGNNRLPTGTTVRFNPGNVFGAAATLDIGSTNQTVAALTFPTGFANPANNMALTIVGTGTLTINGNSNLEVGAGGGASLNNANNHHHTLDMSGLSNFVFNNSAQSIKFALTGNRATNITNVATVNFATNNTITAANLGIGNDGGGAGGGKTTIRLGQTNVWNIGTFNPMEPDNSYLDIGLTRADVDVRFATGLVNPTIKLRAADGTSPLPYFQMGNLNDNGARTWVDVTDFSAGITDAVVSTVVVGAATPSSATRDGTLNATFVLGAGDFTVNHLTIGAFRPSAAGFGTDTTMTANGTFTLNNAAGTLNAATILLADVPVAAGGSGTEATNGTLNILDGVVKATTISLGAQAGGVDVTAHVDFSGGTIQNTDGQDMAISDVQVRLLSNTGTRTINVTGSNTTTLNAGTVVSGVGSLSKAGTGTLLVQGTNTHTGGNIVDAGVLKADIGSVLSGPAGQLATNGSGVVDLNSTNQTVGVLTGNGGRIRNSVVSTTSILTVGGGDAGGGEYFGSIQQGSAAPAGDYNMNGVVDAADFVLWRKDPSSYGGPGGYATWRSNFGSSGAPGGDIQLIKTGTGSVILSGTNTYGGTTTIQAGALAFGTTASLYNNQQGSFAGFWNTTNIVAEMGATLGFGVGGAGSFTEGQVIGFLTTLSDFSGGFKPGSSLGLHATVPSYTFSSVITDAAAGSIGFSKLGANTLVLTGANTYTGKTQIYEGTLSVSQIGNVAGGPSPLGNQATAADATVLLGASTTFGTLRYTGGGTTTNRDFALVGTAGGGGGIEASGTGLLTVTGNISTTTAGAKTFVLSGTNAGNNTIAGTIADGADVTSVRKTGAGKWVLTNNNFYSGTTQVAEGVLEISGAHGGGAYQIGSQSGATGTAILSGTSINSSAAIDVGVVTGSTGVFTLSGGDASAIDLNVGQGTVTIGNGRSMTASNAVLNSAGAGVINVGQGGANANLTTGTGAVAVDTLNLNNGTVTATGGTNIATALTGNGTMNGNVAMGAGSNLAPGLSAGAINFANNLTLDATGTLTIEIGGSTPVTQFDKINVANILTTAGALQINLINGFVPTAGQAFDILDFVGIGGTFASVPSPANWDTSDLLTLGVVKFVALGAGSGLDGGAVPEPTAWVLVGLAATALIGRRSKRPTRN